MSTSPKITSHRLAIHYVRQQISTKNFFAAIRTGNFENVKAYVEGGGDIKILDPNSEKTALGLLACVSFPQGSHERIFHYLVQQGADVNAAFLHGETPLHRAALEEAAWIVPLLIQAGANVNARDVKNETPLFWTCRKNAPSSIRIAKILIANNADANIQSEDVFAPCSCLSQAITHRNLPLLKLLCEKSNADPNLRENPNLREVFREVLPRMWGIHPVTPSFYALKINFQEAISPLAAKGAIFHSRITFRRDRSGIIEIYPLTENIRNLRSLIFRGYAPALKIDADSCRIIEAYLRDE